MKKLLSLMLLAMFAVLFAACGGDDDGAEITTDPPTFDLTLQDFTLESSAAVTFEATFVSNENCKAASDADWCKVSPAQGTLGAERSITISVAENTTAEARTANVTVSYISNGTKIYKATITQPGKAVVPVSAAPVQATMREARNVYEYLVSIYGKKTLSATMANVNWNAAEAELVFNATGKYPAINTFDYIHLSWSPANWIDYTDTKVAEDWWNAGGIVAAGWHWNVPKSEGSGDMSFNTDETTFRPKNIFVEGSWEKKFADETLNKMADMLLLLQDKGIPVIWRPLHEAAGNIYADWNPSHNTEKAWFWWGRDGAETYKKLWRYMFDTFARKGLKNLIWVFTCDTKDHDFYPGDDYVDIVGCDIYNNTNASAIANQYYGMTEIYPNKLTTLSEMGGVAKISAQWNAGAHWLYFMPWYEYNATSLNGHGSANTEWWKDAVSQSFVVTRDQLPDFKTK